MSHYLSTLLPDGLKRQEIERQSLRFSPPIPFTPVLPTEEVSEHEHEIKVKISKQISETAAVFHGGIFESCVIYLDDCAGWETQFSSASEDLVIHLLDMSKADTEETSGDEAQSSNKEAKKHLKLS